MALRRLRENTAYLAVWWVLLGAALLALVTGAAMFGPLTRKNRYLQPEDAASTALPAAIIALTILLILAVTPPPAAAERQGAGVLSNVTGIMVLLLLGYRLIVGADDARDFAPEQLVPGIPLLWLSLVALAVLIFKFERIRRTAAALARKPHPGSGRRSGAGARAARRYGRRRAR